MPALMVPIAAPAFTADSSLTAGGQSGGVCGGQGSNLGVPTGDGGIALSSVGSPGRGGCSSKAQTLGIAGNERGTCGGIYRIRPSR